MKIILFISLLFFLPANAAVYVSTSDRLWPGGVVPIEWDPNISIANRLRVVPSIKIWEDVANVSIVLRDGQADYVHIRDVLRQMYFLNL